MHHCLDPRADHVSGARALVRALRYGYGSMMRMMFATCHHLGLSKVRIRIIHRIIQTDDAYHATTGVARESLCHAPDDIRCQSLTSFYEGNT